MSKRTWGIETILSKKCCKRVQKNRTVSGEEYEIKKLFLSCELLQQLPCADGKGSARESDAEDSG